MYLLDIKKLKHDLKHAPLRQTDSLLSALLALLFYSSDFTFPTHPTLAGTLSEMVFAIAPLLGLAYAFNRNGGTNGRDFLPRFVALSCVVGLRIFVVLLPIFAVAFYLDAFTFEPSFEIEAESQHYLGDTIYTIAETAWILLLYLRLGKHIHDIAQNDWSTKGNSTAP